jgi:hypothetical protein
MIIKNKTVIGFISLCTGLAIVGYLLFTISIIFYGKKTTAQVTGFAYKKNGTKKVQHESSSTSVKGRPPFVKFLTADGKEVEAHSEIIQLFSFTGYTLGDKVSVMYSPKKATRIFILNIKELPGLLLLTVFGFLALAMGKSFIQKKPF